MLAASRQEGAAVLADITRRALKRWLAHGGETLLHADRLFNDAERQDLADAIAATNVTAGLLGRARIRLRQQAALRRYAPEKFAELEEFCGGPGSGRPGPCPSGREDIRQAATAQSAATKATKTVSSKRAALERAKILGRPERIKQAQTDLDQAEKVAGAAVAEAMRLEVAAAKGGPAKAPSAPVKAAPPKAAQGRLAKGFKPTKAKVELGKGLGGDPAKLTQASLETVLGKGATLADAAAVSGAPDDATVKVVSIKKGRLEVEAIGPPRSDGQKSYILQRTISVDDDGKTVIQNDLFKLHPDLQSSGLGTKIFARQVENATAKGVDRFETYAASGGSYNGYYTWPRLGYDSDIGGDLRGRMPASLQKAKNISDLMKSPEGRDWWKANGSGADMAFSLKAGSQSRKVLDAYLKEKAISDYAEPPRPVADADGVEPILLTAEDEEILDRIWEALSDAPDEPERFAEQPWQFAEATDFSIFDDSDDPLRPLPPEHALEWFKRKVPIAGITAKDLTPEANQKFFTLAVDVDAVLLSKIKSGIRDVIETGKAASATPRTIATLLEDAGITQTVGGVKNIGAYAENVFRTNMMESYRQGAQEELAEVEEDFPVYRYVGIADGRQRPSHAVHFDKYYPSSVEFAAVRDSVKGEFDGFQCRCDFIPIYVSEWKRLQAAGAQASSI